MHINVDFQKKLLAVSKMLIWRGKFEAIFHNYCPKEVLTAKFPVLLIGCWEE